MTLIQETAEKIYGGRVDPDWLEELLAFYEPLSIENLQRLLWEELNVLVVENPAADDSAEAANAIRIVLAVRRLSGQ
jgi:hypothetical protein